MVFESSTLMRVFFLCFIFWGFVWGVLGVLMLLNHSYGVSRLNPSRNEDKWFIVGVQYFCSDSLGCSIHVRIVTMVFVWEGVRVQRSCVMCMICVYFNWRQSVEMRLFGWCSVRMFSSKYSSCVWGLCGDCICDACWISITTFLKQLTVHKVVHPGQFQAWMAPCFEYYSYSAWFLICQRDVTRVDGRGYPHPACCTLHAKVMIPYTNVIFFLHTILLVWHCTGTQGTKLCFK